MKAHDYIPVAKDASLGSNQESGEFWKMKKNSSQPSNKDTSMAMLNNVLMHQIDPSQINIKPEEIKVEDQGMPKFKLDLTAMSQNQKSTPLESLTKKMQPTLDKLNTEKPAEKQGKVTSPSKIA